MPPPYKRKVWHYDMENIDYIIKSVEQFEWKRELETLADSPDRQVQYLADVLTNTFTNFIPNDDKVVNPREPAWITENITHYYRKYKKSV